LTTLLKNDLIPDPFYGLNNMEVPDIGEVGREHYTFWFCNKFKLSSVVSELISILVGSLLDNAGCSGEWLQLLESYDTVMSFGL
jgi:hypothetical protein